VEIGEEFGADDRERRRSAGEQTIVEFSSEAPALPSEAPHEID